jgi:ketosteroid isomerase-like protein
MTQRNAEILLQASEAASAGATVEERETFLSILDPDIEWIVRSGPTDLQGEFHGIDRANEYYAQWASAWAEWRWEIEDVREQGDVVVTRTWLTGRGRGSGLVLDMRIGQIWTFHAGKVVRYEALPTWEQALDAAGLSAHPA